MAMYIELQFRYIDVIQSKTMTLIELYKAQKVKKLEINGKILISKCPFGIELINHQYCKFLPT